MTPEIHGSNRSHAPYVPPQERYYLDTGDAAAPRLRLLHRIYGAETRALLERAGLREGMRVADIGCGIGEVTADMARVLGARGHVTAIDASAAQVEQARQTAGAWHDRTDFQVASAYDTGLPREHFDLVYCRFLLCHLQRPLEAIAEMRAILRPGGVLVCEDMEASTIITVPESAIYRLVAEQSVVNGTKRGADFDIGPRLPGYLNGRAFADVQVRVWQPAYYEGEEKRFWEYSFAESAPQAIEASHITRAEADARVAAMQDVNFDPDILLVLPRVWQVWGVKP